MDIENIPEIYKKEAYDMIRSIYKFIPYYNQIKGTYLGMQFILNMMGLCASITELWSTRDDITNFSKDATFFREDEIYATRRFIENVGKSEVKNYYLTSRFDVDINYLTGITLTEFNGMAWTFGAVLAPTSAEKRAFGEAPAKPATMLVGNWRMVVLNSLTVSL